MKICPECGYIDRSHWRQNRWRTNVEFLKYLEQPEDIDPIILEKLKKNNRFTVITVSTSQHHEMIQDVG